jgi:hypothetical protein
MHILEETIARVIATSVHPPDRQPPRHRRWRLLFLFKNYIVQIIFIDSQLLHHIIDLSIASLGRRTSFAMIKSTQNNKP